MGRYRRKLENFMNDFNVRKKLFIIYVFCVIIPLVLTDSIILYILLDAEKRNSFMSLKILLMLSGIIWSILLRKLLKK